LYTEQLPPHDDQAEEAVLGSLIIDSESIPTIAASLEPGDFFRQKNSWVFEACLNLFSRNEPINQISLADELARKQRLEEVGGLQFLSHLIAIVPTSVYIENYGQVVKRLSVMRQLITTGGKIVEIGYQAEVDENEALRKAEDFIYQLRMGRSEQDLVSLHTALDEYLEEGASSDQENGAGVATGFMDLDKLLGGLQSSDLVVLAARPGVGKSALALNIAKAVTGQRHPDGRGRVVAFFSLEMATNQIIERLLAGETGIDTRRLRQSNEWSEQDEAKVMQAAGNLADLAMYIDDSAMLGVVELRSKARRLYLEEGLDLIVVDYLQLMNGGGGFGGNRVQEISEISRSLKALARDLNVPVLALSQLSRAVEGRTGHEPMLSDLRDSGSIEQDADVVMFIYRPDVYFTEEEWERQHPGEDYPRGIADLIIAKHRNGPLGRPQLIFKEKTTTFVDAALSDGPAPGLGMF
jgi:replicative DNA helicase